MTECSKHDSCGQELDEYDTAISTILEELDKFVSLINLYFVYINQFLLNYSFIICVAFAIDFQSCTNFR